MKIDLSINSKFNHFIVLKEKILSSLTEKDKKIIFIVSTIFCVLTGVFYMIRRWASGYKKQCEAQLKKHYINPGFHQFKLHFNTVPKIDLIPKNLHHLDLRQNSHVTDEFLSQLSGDLCILILVGCEKIKSLGLHLPQKLQALNLFDCIQLKDDCIISLPKTLKAFCSPPHFTDNALKHFPKEMRVLSIKNCEDYKKLPNLPENLEVLDANETDLDPEFINNLPKKLRVLALEFYSHPISTEDALKLPQSLEILNLSVCKKINKDLLANLPKNLKVLNLSHCVQLKDEDLQNLPEGLEALNLYGCPYLTQKILQTLPKCLKQLVMDYNLPDKAAFDQYCLNHNIDQNFAQPNPVPEYCSLLNKKEEIESFTQRLFHRIIQFVA